MRAAGTSRGPALGPLEWLRMGTLGGAEVLGMAAEIGSLESGKQADLIAIDPAFTAAVPGATDDDPEDLMSRLIFRSHPDMVRAAWVRGRRLEGPGQRG
jgi:cytosine/adenosine deaminase-related metal-dependent hydrolase